MSIRLPLLIALLACFASAHAAHEPRARKPAPPARVETAAQDIDVDAMARAKDVGARPAANADAAAASAEAVVAPPDETAPAAPEPKPEEIDVDAMARAKDGKPAEPLAEPATEAAPAPAPKDAGAVAAEPATAPVDEAPAAPAEASPPEADAAAATAAQVDERPSPLAPEPPPSATEKRLVGSCEARASALLDAAQKGDYAGATRDFDATMRGALPPPKFEQAWESLAQFGRLQARGQSHPMRSNGYIAITIPLIFDKANLYAQVACGSDGRIAGFYVKPL
ncbi:MAG TPA: DUF3887 domain-containing protein [Dokdonella sp.]|nr:DUF3887 domain-containing protein [Dokdonella sp.]